MAMGRSIACHGATGTTGVIGDGRLDSHRGQPSQESPVVGAVAAQHAGCSAPCGRQWSQTTVEGEAATVIRRRLQQSRQFRAASSGDVTRVDVTQASTAVAIQDRMTLGMSETGESDFQTDQRRAESRR